MDGSKPQGAPVNVAAGVQLIKEKMPKTYASIQAKAEVIGRPAFALVRRSIAGEANLFYAIEAGHVVGTPFEACMLSAEVARWMVAFGTASVVMWGEEAKAEVTSGA